MASVVASTEFAAVCIPDCRSSVWAVMATLVSISATTASQSKKEHRPPYRSAAHSHASLRLGICRLRDPALQLGEIEHHRAEAKMYIPSREARPDFREDGADVQILPLRGGCRYESLKSGPLTDPKTGGNHQV